MLVLLNYPWNTTSWSVLFLISGHLIFICSVLLYIYKIFSNDISGIVPKLNTSLQLIDRAMAELRVLRLFGNPLEFLPDILPLNELRHLSLANIRIVADENLVSVSVLIEVCNGELFGWLLCRLRIKLELNLFFLCD